MFNLYKFFEVESPFFLFSSNEWTNDVRREMTDSKKSLHSKVKGTDKK